MAGFPLKFASGSTTTASAPAAGGGDAVVRDRHIQPASAAVATRATAAIARRSGERLARGDAGTVVGTVGIVSADPAPTRCNAARRSAAD